MKNLKINFQPNIVPMYGNSIALAEVKSISEQNAESILDRYLQNNYPDLGRKECHFVDEVNNIFYFAIVSENDFSFDSDGNYNNH